MLRQSYYQNHKCLLKLNAGYIYDFYYMLQSTELVENYKLPACICSKENKGKYSQCYTRSEVTIFLFFGNYIDTPSGLIASNHSIYLIVSYFSLLFPNHIAFATIK